MFAVPTILLIEDTPIIREPLTRLLRNEGFDVHAASDGSDGFAVLGHHAVDLILLDVLMPHMNGVTFLEALRRDPRLMHVPVIAVTGTSDSTKLSRLRELGVRTILHKVRFTFDQLVSEIHAQLAETAK